MVDTQRIQLKLLFTVSDFEVHLEGVKNIHEYNYRKNLRHRILDQNVTRMEIFRPEEYMEIS